MARGFGTKGEWPWLRTYNSQEVVNEPGSRHPNYYGECLVWLGISMCSAAILMSSAAQQSIRLGLITVSIMCSLTPYFVYKLLRNISIPVIEEKMDREYMEIKEYRIWRRDRTFRLWLDGSGILYGYA